MAVIYFTAKSQTQRLILTLIQRETRINSRSPPDSVPQSLLFQFACTGGRDCWKAARLLSLCSSEWWSVGMCRPHRCQPAPCGKGREPNLLRLLRDGLLEEPLTQCFGNWLGKCDMSVSSPEKLTNILTRAPSSFSPSVLAGRLRF